MTTESIDNEMKNQAIEALELGKKIPPAQLPLILVYAMSGKKPDLPGVPSGLVSHTSNFEDPEIKGLVLTKTNIVYIKKYVKEALLLPTTLSSEERYTGYSESEMINELKTLKPDASEVVIKNNILLPSKLLPVHEYTNNHARKWAIFESRIKQVGTDVNIFAKDFVIVATDLIEVISEMPIMERIRTTIGKSSIEIDFKFDEDDTEIKYALIEMLDDLKKSTDRHSSRVGELAKDLTKYSADMDTDILPFAINITDEISTLNFSDKITELTNQIVALQKEIDGLNDLYDKQVGYAFTGAAGMVFPPVGIISWAITGGIFGDKAEKTRKLKNKKIKERNQLNKTVTELSAFSSKMLNFKSKTDEFNSKLKEAATGLRNLEALWQSISSYITDAKNNLNSINDGTRLNSFMTDLSKVKEKWVNVRDMTYELIVLFKEAQEEVDSLK
ncbi:MAG: alpha-xenorhabdolysin family binary toxin subunit A [Methanobrevibacter sp.]|jgi:uncharacterized coiled-coil DUF342 family protein|nr:alpha-xenorhabdolysin family binary toxin subunit A [Methanobrevibacter sp.]